jgi:hypothetical protein
MTTTIDIATLKLEPASGANPATSTSKIDTH